MGNVRPLEKEGIGENGEAASGAPPKLILDSYLSRSRDSEFEWLSSRELKHDPLDLIERDLVVAPIIELGCAGALVRRHLLRIFEQPAIE